MVEEIKKYDKRGNWTYCRNSYDYTWWREYDENNYCIHWKDNKGYEDWYRYNDEYRTRIEITEEEFNQIEDRKKRKSI